jgi:hypothetical protein
MVFYSIVTCQPALAQNNMRQAKAGIDRQAFLA